VASDKKITFKEKREMKKVMMFAAVLCMVVSLTAAAEESSCQKTIPSVPETYVAPMGTQFVRGITNVITGWGEIPRQMVLEADDSMLLMVPVGLARGIMMTCARTVYGAAEAVFFIVPFGENYESAMKPAYVWQEEPAKKAKAVAAK
jgi:putative exosortase-associated protein (TIGR04073 family)